MDQRPKVGVGLFIKKGHKVFLMRRINAHGTGTWSVPGGHLEYGEGWEEAAKREAFEEAGIRVKNVRFGTVTNDIFKKEGKHYITIYMISDYLSGKERICEPGKCDNIGWFEWKKLPKPLFLPFKNALKQNFNPFK